MPYDDYKKDAVSSMRGKTSSLRSLTSIPVEGSMKMVITPYAHTGRCVIYVPSHIAASTVVPKVDNGMVVRSCIETGDVGILIRQPCL